MAEEKAKSFSVEDLKTNDAFLRDASRFLRKRTGQALLDPEQITDEFMSHFRQGLVNEVTLLRDLDYARKASDEDKKIMNNMIRVYEKVDPEYSLQAAGDIAEGLAKAPSTYIGALTGFAGKGAATAGMAATRGALRKVLDTTMRAGALPGAARSSVAGAGASAFATDVEQRTREEVGLGRDDDAVLTSAIAGGVLGGAIGGIGGAIGGSLSKGADELAETAQTSISARNLAQREAAKKTREKLRPLDKDLVEEGDALLEELNQTKALTSRLSGDTIDAVAAAAMKLGQRIGRKPEERITETVARGISEGRIDTDAFKEILDEHNLTTSQFAAGYMATVSNAARTLGKQSQIRRSLQTLADRGVLDPTPEELAELEKGATPVLDFLKSVDRLRLATMTSQMVTTARNVVGGGYRLFVDALDEGFDSMLGALRGKKSVGDAFKDVSSTTKYMLNTKDAAVVQQMLTQEMPTEARKLFFSAADAEARVGSTSRLAKFGAGINYLNTKTDEVFKRAAFTSSLDRQLREAGKPTVTQHIRDGAFGQIDEKMIKQAVEDSLYFTYQKRPSRDTVAGTLANSVIDAHREAPFIVSAFIPFPRFIANQMQFAVEHAPILPIALKGLAGQGVTQRDFARQMSTATLLYTAIQYRETQDPSTKWNEHIDSEGKVLDMAPVFGPLAPIMLMADMYVRMERGDPIPSLAKYGEEAMRSLGTPRFSGSFGIPSIDRLWEDLSDAKYARAAGKLAGDVAGTFLIPAIMVRDIAAVYDEDQMYIRNMDRVLPSTGEPVVDFLNYTMHYATKNMPVSFGPEERRSSITQGVLTRVNPLERQFTGFTRYENKSLLQKELDRLQIDRRQLMTRSQDPIRNAMTEGFVGNILPARMASFINSDDYQNMSDIVKGQQIRLMARKVITDEGIKEYVDEAMKEMVGLDKDRPYRQFFREAYENLPTDTRRILEEMWRSSPEYNGESIQESGAYHWAIERSDRVTGLQGR